MSNKEFDKLTDDIDDWEPMECPFCKQIALIVIHHGEEWDELECQDCGHFQIMVGTQHE